MYFFPELGSVCGGTCFPSKYGASENNERSAAARSARGACVNPWQMLLNLGGLIL